MKARWEIWVEIDDIEEMIESTFIDDNQHYSHVLDYWFKQLDQLSDELAQLNS